MVSVLGINKTGGNSNSKYEVYEWIKIIHAHEEFPVDKRTREGKKGATIRTTAKFILSIAAGYHYWIIQPDLLAARILWDYVYQQKLYHCSNLIKPLWWAIRWFSWPCLVNTINLVFEGVPSPSTQLWRRFWNNKLHSGTLFQHFLLTLVSSVVMSIHLVLCQDLARGQFCHVIAIYHHECHFISRVTPRSGNV